ncbi:shikimate dehydrogenase [Hydrogenoanaerobacterium sp.]|uniref:shikimate dehydrogenase family protein n=1 Tax=Hydrogenoanaerobacterium sp. TaxID=2953763 RepID=UPI0028A0B8EB|nr:shikimate dehydrogenase [Hydrogenoanaerobacterium sp.]
MTRKFGILGYPLGHTMSPPIHKRLFELSGHTDDYDIYEISPEELTDKMPMLKALSGFNVTIPHKVGLLGYMDELDETALRYKALNVVSCGSRYIGYNTDCYGFRKTIEQMGADLSRSVCVLGAGGVGRMFAIESALCGAQVTLAVRASGVELAQRVQFDIRSQIPEAQVRIVEIETLHLLGEDFHLLINATPVGMYPKVDAMAVDPALLPRCEYVFDSVYNPTVTKLMREAQAAGCKVAGGMAMLVWQAVKAHEIWDNAHYSTNDITALINEMAAAVDEKFKLF